MTQRRVTMVGSFPPPIGGAALVNQMVLEALRGKEVDVVPLDVSGPVLAHSRSLGYHVCRIAANVRAAGAARRLAGRDHLLYLVPDAGAGAWYTASLAHVAARAYGSCVIHHHSCRYIEEQSRPVALFTERTRDQALHVFLTPGMATGFAGRYGAVRSLVATNARFVAVEAEVPLAKPVGGPLRLGHLSNLCADKGFFVVADTFDALRAAGKDVTLQLAGPALDAIVQARLSDLLARHGERVTYRGPVSGEAKRDVYRTIDVFLFPTRFRQEAAPLVVYEALAAGVPVLATDRGAIDELIGGSTGAVCPRDVDFTRFAARWIVEQAGNPADRHARSLVIKRQIQEACAISSRQYDMLLELLAGGALTV